MLKDDAAEFLALIDATMEVTGHTASMEAKRIWWSALQAYDIADIRQAFTAHLMSPSGRYRVTPSHILEQLASKAPQWPSSDEAWAIAQGAEDEAITVVWTDEAARAYAIASPLIEAGDKIAARKAFQSAYDRLVDEAKALGAAPSWSVSEGFDGALRATAIESAVRSGWLSQQQAAPLLLQAPVSEGGRAIAGLLTGESNGRGIPADKADQLRKTIAQAGQESFARALAEYDLLNKSVH